MGSLHGIPFSSPYPTTLGYNNPDTEFSQASLRVCFCFPSTPEIRSMSRTHDVLYAIVKRHFGAEVFVDFAFMPQASVASAVKKKSIPEWYGIISKRTLSDFDVVGVSIAISGTEIFNAYRLIQNVLLREKARSGSKIKLTIAGGIAVDTAISLYKFFDAVILGMGERSLPAVLGAALKRKGQALLSESSFLADLAAIPGVLVPSFYRMVSEPNASGTVDSYTAPRFGSLPPVRPDVNLDSSMQIPGWYGALPYSTYEDKAVVPVSIGCIGRSCRFCHEGNMFGLWRESSPQHVAVALAEAKAQSMSGSVSLQSYSLSLYSSIQSILVSALSQFDRVHALNFRADALAARPELAKLLRMSGSSTVAFAVEGLGSRIRNLVLKKHLTPSDLLTAATAVFNEHFDRLKLGYMATGYEDDDDIELGLIELEEIAAKRRLISKTTKTYLSYTDLIHFPGTPLFKYSRDRAYALYLEALNKKAAPRLFDNRVGDMGYNVKYAESGGRAHITQLLFDTGFMAEEVLLKPAYHTEVSPTIPEFARIVDKAAKARDLNPEVILGGAAPSFYRHGSFIYDGYFSEYPDTDTETCKDSCVSCGQCRDADIVPSFSSEPIDLSRVEETRMENSAAFQYLFVFKFPKEVEHVDKRVLLRKALASIVPNPQFFRRVEWSLGDFFEVDRFPSHYHGVFPAVLSFSRPLPEIAPSAVPKEWSLESVKSVPYDWASPGELYIQSRIIIPPSYRTRFLTALELARDVGSVRLRPDIFHFEYVDRPFKAVAFEEDRSGVRITSNSSINPLWAGLGQISMPSMADFQVIVQDVMRVTAAGQSVSLITNSIDTYSK